VQSLRRWRAYIDSMNGINPNAGYGFWKRLLSNRGRSLLFGKPVFLPNESPTAVSATGYNVPLAANPCAEDCVHFWTLRKICGMRKTRCLISEHGIHSWRLADEQHWHGFSRLPLVICSLGEPRVRLPHPRRRTRPARTHVLSPRHVFGDGDNSTWLRRTTKSTLAFAPAMPASMAESTSLQHVAPLYAL